VQVDERRIFSLCIAKDYSGSTYRLLLPTVAVAVEKLAKETTFNIIFNEANLLQLSSSLKIITK
jgi:hypothetical protein